MIPLGQWGQFFWICHWFTAPYWTCSLMTPLRGGLERLLCSGCQRQRAAGCCETLVVMTMPRMRRLEVSRWASRPPQSWFLSRAGGRPGTSMAGSMAARRSAGLVGIFICCVAGQAVVSQTPGQDKDMHRASRSGQKYMESGAVWHFLVFGKFNEYFLRSCPKFCHNLPTSIVEVHVKYRCCNFNELVLMWMMKNQRNIFGQVGKNQGEADPEHGHYVTACNSTFVYTVQSNISGRSTDPVF